MTTQVAPLFDHALERSYLAVLLATSADDELCSPERVEPSDLAHPQHERILAAIHALHRSGEPIDEFTVLRHVERDGANLSVREALKSVDAAPLRLGDVRARAERIQELARMRRARERLQRALAAIEAGNLGSAIDHAKAVEGDAAERAQDTGTTLYRAAEIATSHIDVLTPEAASSMQYAERLGTGYAVLDDAIGSLPRATMHVVGGRTGCGKSTVMLGMALAAAQRFGRRVGIVSCEDAPDVWGARGLSNFAQISQFDLMATHLPVEKLGQIEIGLRALERVGVRLEYALNRPLVDVLRCIRALVVRHGCEVIFVDYVQAIRMSGGKSERHDRLVSDAVQALKSECQAFGVPLVLGSQVKRPEGAKAYTEPQMFDLKETGDIENMAESIVLLWKTSDDDNARMLGKVAKVKWSKKRPRFELQMNPDTGALADIVRYEDQAQNASREPFAPRERRWGT